MRVRHGDNVGWRRRGEIALPLVMATLFGLAFTGCDDDIAQADRVLEQVRHQLTALNVSSGQLAPVATRRKVYASVIRDLNPLVSADMGGRGSAAAQLLARAQAGEATIRAAQAQSLEERSLRIASQARAVLARYLQSHALAAALSAVSSDDEISRLEQGAQEHEAARIQAQEQQSKLTSELEELRSKAQDQRQAARAMRDKAGKLRSGSLELAGQERVDLISEAVGIERSADLEEVEAELLEARITRRAPEVVEAGRGAARQAGQRDALRSNAQSLRRREQVQSEQAQINIKAAAGAATELDAILKSLVALHEGELQEAYEQAASSRDAAVRSQRKAAKSAGRSGLRQASQAALGQALQAAGDVRLARAQGTRRVALSLTQAADAEPQLSEASGYRQLAQQRLELAQDLKMQAAQSFSEALQAFQGAGASNASMRHLEQLIQSISPENADTGQAPDDNAGS